MSRFSPLSLLLAATALTAVPASAAFAAEQQAAQAASDLTSLVEQVRIDHESFQLDNGLTVLVHEDRKAPIVAVSVWYNVGSKDEPKGKTGFAHLFEHLMFNGSENLPGDYFEWTEKIGATNLNGTTWYDRTNYFQNVPTGALERVLFMESDRMGYLLGAVTQEKLDNQRGVVQNEKRQGDNRPGGLVGYAVSETLFPEGHPYRHSTIGSMADLDSATLGDVQNWFIDKYGPNNAILVLAGDIDAETARPLVEKYFGEIGRGKVNNPAQADIPTLDEAKRLVMHDRIPTPRVQKHWVVGGLNDEDTEALEIAARILGGLASSRLDAAIVRGDESANNAYASYTAFHRLGRFSMGAEAKVGTEVDALENSLNRVLTEFVVKGPTQAEVDRAVTDMLADRIRGLEQVGGFGGKANAIAEGKLYSDDSDYYRKTLEDYAELTPEMVRAAAAKWLARPSVTVNLMPGERPPYEEAKGGSAAPGAETRVFERTVRELPPIGVTQALDFPDVEHVRLSNGAMLHYAHRDTVPVTQMVIEFDAGNAADSIGKSGLAAMTMALLEEGAGDLDAQAIAETRESLGTDIRFGNSMDESTVAMSTLSNNLGASLDLVGLMLKEPTFAEGEINRVRSQALAGIARAKSSPNGLLAMALPRIIYGENDPYGASPYGSEEAIKAFSRDDLVSFQQRFLRPDNMEVYVVSDLSLEEVKAAIDAEFGTWQAPAVAKGTKLFPERPKRPSQQQVILIDRPDSPQSIVAAAQILPVDPSADLVDLNAANEALGGSFLSRINMDLRESKGWSYGVRGSVRRSDEDVAYYITAPVQADRTADSLVALDGQVRAFLGDKGVTKDELERIVASNVAALPGQFETASAVLSGMRNNVELGRPDDYYETLSEKYRAQTQEGLDGAIREVLDPEGWVWVIVGDARAVRPQLEAAGIEYEMAGDL
ncbi:M16 family metallopeptidase [Sphingomicrobium lutaoense]|uniref:Putative Zn-dependent peptidase n=1 Tax=Sphingomicrobium lutaoense TaxID=515949 RepID=A0A839Z5W9_9SPHN|nr:pitrilysin family protein [Sphingomicrobium lutaoense]MBB3765012.1 putative Zn-dependent peptidase [Sphingomicrobium lutaoense]